MTQENSTSSGPQIRTDSPMIRDVSSPNRSVLSSTKSWCSSPFSNLGALSPDSHSLTFSLGDLSPGLTFSSPRNRFSELPSPQSSSRFSKDYGSIFSPSLFSPFNKSLNPNKMDKLGIDPDDVDPDQSRLLSGLSDTPDMFQRAQSILPQLLKAADYQADGSHRSNLNEVGFDFEDFPNANNSSKKSITAESSHTRITTDPHSPTDRQTTLKGNELKSILRNIQSTPSPKSNFSSPPVLAKAKQTNMSPSMEQKSHCNCKKSRCLKLYCECFAALRYCSACNCTDCNNCQEFETVRQDAIQSTRDRNPSAFQMKVSVKRGHVAGCNCKKSRCLKKYCECFEGSVFCGPNCKCVECQNLAGSEALKQVKSRDKKERPQRIETSGPESPVPETASPKLSQPSSFEGVSATPFKIRSRKFIQDESLDDGTRRDLLPPDQAEPSLKSFECPNISSCPLKKRKVDFAIPEMTEPVYPFFGPHRPTTKLIALSCLEYLDGPSLYSMSCVNRIWCQASMDDALWE